MIVQAVQQLLSEDTPITEIVGDAIHYAERPGIPQLYMTPAIVLQLVSAPGDHHFKGRSGVTFGLVRVTCLADSYLGAQDLAAAVKAKLDAYAGTLTLTGADDAEFSLRIGYLFLDDDTELPSDHRDGQGQIKTHGRQVDFKYAHRDPVAL